MVPGAYACTKRFITNESRKKGSKRFMQTIPVTSNGDRLSNDFYSGLNYAMANQTNNVPTASSNPLSKWSSHKLAFPTDPSPLLNNNNTTTNGPIKRSRNSRFGVKSETNQEPTTIPAASIVPEVEQSKIIEIESPKMVATTNSSEQTNISTSTSTTPKKKRTLRPRKALITLSSNAVDHLLALLQQPTPKLIRIGVRNRGCSGLTYHLEYVDEPGKFDELIEQDGVKVLIDSKALFSIVGSEMDWLDDKLSSRFIFKNPNSKGTCGCGESFMV